MFAVYEVIDLGLISVLSDDTSSSRKTMAELIEANHTVFYSDPIHEDTVYVYHSFGVHVLNLNPIFQNIAAAMRDEAEEKLQNTIENHANTAVQPILSTVSFDRRWAYAFGYVFYTLLVDYSVNRSSNTVTSVVIPNDVYLTYSIFVLTTSLRLVTFALNLRTEAIEPPPLSEQQGQLALPALPPSGPPAYNSLLTAQPFTIPPIFERPIGLPSMQRLSLPQDDSAKTQLNLTPETLRYLANAAERISIGVKDAQLAWVGLKTRIEQQRQEYDRLQKTAVVIITKANELSGPKKTHLQEKMKAVQDQQKDLLARMDRVLRTLIKSASPELNEHETRWFGELERMKAQVLGVGRYDQDSLKSRVRLVSNNNTWIYSMLTT